MAKQEQFIRSNLMAQLKMELPGFVFLRHEDVRQNGHPDLSATGIAKTTWWEIKHGTPDFETNGIQELTMLRLAAAGYARYIVFEERKEIQRTLIIHPRHIATVSPEASTIGFDYKWVANYIREVHACAA